MSVSLLAALAVTAFAATICSLPAKEFSHDVYPGVDLAAYMANDGAFEYDWEVRPSGDASAIRMYFPFADAVRIGANGDLVVIVGRLEVRHSRPVIYQDIGGARRIIDGRFVLVGDKSVGFEVARYDLGRTLVIDPQISVSASFGGSGFLFAVPDGPTTITNDSGLSVATDAAGNIYVAGDSYSGNFPLVNSTAPVFNPVSGECTFFPPFIAKLDPSGKELVYSVYVGNPYQVYCAPNQGPPSPSTTAVALAVDPTGNAYVTGGLGMVVEKLDPSGKVVWSQDLGGLAETLGTSIALEASGRVAVVGTTQSAKFPVTPNAYSDGPSASTSIFLLELDPGSGAVTYATYIGPSDLGSPFPKLCAIPDGDVVVAASTNLANWPTTPGAVQPAFAGVNGPNVVIMKLDLASSALIWSTYLGGSSANLSNLAAGPDGDIYLTGTTSSDFPFTPGSVRAEASCKAFLTRLNSTATSLVYSTCAGGKSLAVDTVGDAFVTGGPSDIAVFRAFQATPIWADCSNVRYEGSLVFTSYQLCSGGAVVTAINPSGSGLLWSTYLGTGTANGLTVDSSGNVTITGTRPDSPARPYRRPNLGSIRSADFARR